MLQNFEADNFLGTMTPLEKLREWHAEAEKSGIRDANAMSVSTITDDGTPSARVVLCKEFATDHLVFFTNYDSAKGEQISRNNKVGILFYWNNLFRQVKLRGKLAKVSAAESDKYWNSRPRASQLSQYVSHQSKPVKNRETMEALVKEAERNFHGQDVPRPKNWGGYQFTPTFVEFWIGRESRFHDRFAYQKVESAWKGQRLFP